MDHETQQLDDNNPKSEANPDATPEAASDSVQETPPEAVAQGSAEPSEAASPEPVSSMSPDERKAALEAIIYAADEPATIEQLAKALDEPKAEVQAALDELVASYASDTRGIEIRGVAGGYKMYTKPQHHDLVRRFIKSLRPPLRLTMPALETLAVISYKQPVTAPEIQEIRGVNTSGVIKTLLDKKLITTAGRKEVIGRPILYRTSKEFLMRFGLSDLGELPSLKEFEALAREALGTDEGVAEGESGDESVLDSVEPTEAEAAAELEAEAAADSNAAESGETATPKAEAAADSNAAESGETATPKAEAAAAGADESSTPKQYEQSISPDVAEAIASHRAEAAATMESEPEPPAAVAESSEEPASKPIVEAVAETPLAPESHESVVPAAQESEPEPVDAQSESVEPTFAAAESTEAVGIGMETPASADASIEPEASYENEQEISDEILAQLTQGIEIEVSADSLAALSSTEVPSEEAPARFYSSDAEPERQSLPSAEATEHAGDQASSPENESATEKEKSRKAAAGE